MDQKDNASPNNPDNLTYGNGGQVIRPTTNQPQSTETNQPTVPAPPTTSIETPTIQPNLYQSFSADDTQQPITNDQQTLNNTTILPNSDNKAPWLKLIIVTFLLGILIRAVHFVFGVLAGLLVFGGTGPVVPIILLFVPNILVIALLTRFLLALSKRESIILASVMTALYTFGFLNIRIGYDFAASLRGNSNFFGGSLSIVVTSLIVWVTLILLYLAITSARTNKQKTALYCGIILTYIFLVFIYNTIALRSGFRNMIEQESAERYMDITFDPYTVKEPIDGYTIDDQVYITKNPTDITDLKTYYVPPAGKGSDFFWIQQFETNNPLASEQCLDESNDQNKYYTDTLALDCISFYTTTDGHKAYYLKPDQETLKKNAFFAHSVFLVIDDRMIIVRAQRIPETRNVENLLKEIVENLVQVDRESFFGVQGLEITTQTSEAQ